MGSQQLLPGLALVLPLAPADTRPQAVRAHGHVFLPLLQSSKAVVGTVSPLQPAALQRQAGQQPAQADTQLAAVHTAAAAAVRTATARTAAAVAAGAAAARTETARTEVAHTAAAGAVAAHTAVAHTAAARTEAAGAVVAHTAAARTEVAGAEAVHTAAARIPVQADKAAATAPAARRHKVVAPHRLARLALRVPHAIQPLAAEDGHPASKGLVGSPDQPGQHRPVLLWSPRQRRQAAQPPSGR